jgi:hypothetical protein
MNREAKKTFCRIQCRQKREMLPFGPFLFACMNHYSANQLLIVESQEAGYQSLEKFPSFQQNGGEGASNAGVIS